MGTRAARGPGPRRICLSLGDRCAAGGVGVVRLCRESRGVMHRLTSSPALFLRHLFAYCAPGVWSLSGVWRVSYIWLAGGPGTARAGASLTLVPPPAPVLLRALESSQGS